MSQPSPSRVLSTTESPQRGSTHVVRHGAFGVFAFAEPASHCSPLTVSTMLLPQTSSERQSFEQPSPDTTLPSSHASPFVLSKMPSPQRCRVQFVRHVAFGLLELLM